jgi:PAS domain S-box-containing protein
MFEAMVESSEDAIVAYAPDGTILTWNHGAEVIFGYAADEVIGGPFSVVMPAERRAGLEEYTQLVLQERAIPHRRGIGVRKDGRRIHVSVTSWPVRDHLGETTAVATTIRDVTNQQEAKEAQEMLASIVTSSEDAISSATLDGTISTWNQGAEAMLGYTREEILGENVSLLAPPGRGDRLAKILETVKKGEAIGPFDTVLRAKNGTGVNVSFSIFPIRNADGEVVGTSGIARGIAQRLRTERKLRESEDLFHQVFEHAPIGICISGLDGSYLHANSTFCAMLGYSEKELMGRSWMELTHAEDLPLAQRMKELLLAAPDETVTWEKRFIHRSGSIVWTRLRVSLVRDEEGKPLHTVVHVEDITESRKTAAALEESEARFRKIFVESGSVMLLMELESGKIVSANLAAAEYYGYTQEQLAGMSINQINVQAAPEVTAQRLRARTEKQLRLEFRHRLASGEERDVECYVSSIDMGGKPMAFSIVHDVSERKRAEIELRDSEEKFLLLTENIRELFWIMNGTGTEMLYLSPAFEHIWGIPRETVYGNLGKLMEVIHSDDRGQAETIFKQQLRGECTTFQFRVSSPGGQERWILDRAIPIRDVHGRVMKVVGLTEDITESKRAEVALVESEARFRKFFEENGSVMLLIDPARREIMDANRAAANFYGYPRERMLGMSMALINTQSHAEIIQERKRAVDKGRPYFNFHHRLASGEVRDVECYYSLIAVNGRSVQFTVLHDVTDRKQHETRLREVTERLSLATRAGGVGVWVHELSTGRMIWDEQMCLLYGIEPGAFGGTLSEWSEMVHPEDRQRLGEEARESHKNDGVFTFEHRIVWPDGSVHHIRAFAQGQRDESGQLVQVIGTNWDITAQKQAAEELLETNRYLEEETARSNKLAEETARANAEARESALYLQTLFDTLPVGIFVVDAETRLVLDINPHAQKLIGLEKDHIVGRSCNDSVCPAADRRCPILDLGQSVDHSERILLTAENRRLPVLKSVSPLVKDGRNVLVESFLDISAQKHAAASLLELNRSLAEESKRTRKLAEEANKANAAKSEFLANMSHEIRTPMNGIVGITNLLLDTNLDDTQRSYAGIVQDCAENLLGLINGILDLSKIEAGKVDLEIRDFDLQTTLEDLASGLAVRAQNKGLELLFDVDSAVPTMLRGDPLRTRQILTNLAGNAVKFTNAGEIELNVSLAEETDETALLRFTVRDTGIGIPESKMDRLFNKFSQVDSSTTRVYGGTGLGLSISKQLAELMGGNIGVSSEEGEGSEFWFTARFGKQSSARAVQDPVASLLGLRVLIVQRNATSRRILKNRLTSAGMRTVEAEDYPRALQALYGALEEKDPFRASVIDIQLAGMSGETLAKIIKSDPILREMRVVLLESMGSSSTSRPLEEAGGPICISKPVRVRELLSALSRPLSETRNPGKVEDQPDNRAYEPPKQFAGIEARILLVEDNAVNQQVALGILKKLGLSADVASNGVEAIHSLESHPYDLVLMDIQMPEMDGIQATQKIRSSSSPFINRAIPIIAMTAHAQESDRAQCIDAGMNDYLSKPVYPMALADTLRRWLPRQDGSTAEAKAEAAQHGAPQPSLPAVFDQAGMLDRLMNDEELMQIVIHEFLNDMPKQIEALRNLVAGKDMLGAQRKAHLIKGAAANVGGEALRAVAIEMEKAAKAGNVDHVAARVNELGLQFLRLKKAMTDENEPLENHQAEREGRS